MLNQILNILGVTNLSGRWYGFWSGFGSDLGEFAIFGGLIAAYRRHTCHVDHPRFCWRPGTHPVAGTPYRACKKHHPDIPDKVSAHHIAQAHREQFERLRRHP